MWSVTGPRVLWTLFWLAALATTTWVLVVTFA